MIPLRSRGIFLAPILLAAALRFPGLAACPMHTDEAVHADKFGTLLEGGGYVYDPSEYHGPTLYAHLGAGAFLGTPGAAVAALLAAISPAMVFYSRYYVHETPLVLSTFGALLGACWYLRKPGVVPALVTGGCVGSKDATKETAPLVGFGGGYTLERLAPLVSPERVAGVELSEVMIAAVRQRCGDAYDLHLADAAALPFPEASFDVVLSVNTIYFWPDPARVLAEMNRVLKPGGRLVLGYRSGLVFRMTPLTWFGFRLHGDRRIGQLLEEAGFAAGIRAARSEERIAVGTKA